MQSAASSSTNIGVRVTHPTMATDGSDTTHIAYVLHSTLAGAPPQLIEIATSPISAFLKQDASGADARVDALGLASATWIRFHRAGAKTGDIDVCSVTGDDVKPSSPAAQRSCGFTVCVVDNPSKPTFTGETARAYIWEHATARHTGWFGSAYDTKYETLLAGISLVPVVALRRVSSADAKVATFEAAPSPSALPTTPSANDASSSSSQAVDAPVPDAPVVAPSRVKRWVTAYPAPLYADLMNAVERRRRQMMTIANEIAWCGGDAVAARA